MIPTLFIYNPLVGEAPSSTKGDFLTFLTDEHAKKTLSPHFSLA